MDQRLVAGRYRLRSELGRGGMGVVWLAEDTRLHRDVAVKEITYAPDVSAEERAVLHERTLREARAAARLDHPAVTTVHDVFEEDGKPWLVMEHVPSRTLLQLVQEQGPLPVDVVARIGLDLLAAVAAAHEAGIVHRDVKPANVLVDDTGRAHLTDFGIATTTGDSTLTTQGAVLGSPSFMSPERAHGTEPRPESDLWSVGATLYTAVEGRPPFDRGDPMSTLLAVVSDPPAPMQRAGALAPVLTALLDKDPMARATAAQATAFLHGALYAPPPARPAPAAGPTPQPEPGPERGPEPGPAPSRTEAEHGGRVERFDRSDLRVLAHSAKEVLRPVAHEAAEHVRERARARTDRHRPPPAPEPRRRRRFKRRWVLIPTLLVLLVLLLLAVGVAALFTDMGSLLGG